MLTTLALYAIVFISGAAVLILEILGTRVLGPFYGVSLFLWSALITVTLAALSIGYAVGGRMADRNPRYSRLAAILAGAGVLVFVVPWIRGWVLNFTEPMGLRAAVLVSATLLFGLPLTLMGMVSPYAIRLHTRTVQVVGRTAGNIYAVSTVASVLAALATGFVLIPAIGVNQLLAATGAALLVAAALAWMTDPEKSKAAPVRGGVAVLIGAVGVLTVPVPQAQPDKGLMMVDQSPYAEIRVVDSEGFRYLLIDGGGHTVISTNTMRTYFPYVVVMDLNKYMYQDAGNVLLMGLGGASVVKSFDRSGWDVDVVEIDPGIVQAATDFFDLRPDEATIFQQDARAYLRTHDTVYDLILIDAFGSGSIPFHLVTKEAFAEVKRHLKPGGNVAMNVESIGWDTQLVRSIAATLKENFKYVLALPISEPPNTLGNLVILASDEEPDFPVDMLGRPYDYLDDEYEHWRVLEQNHAWNNRFVPDFSKGTVLTDNHNPVDLWSERVNLAARRMLHTEFEWKDLVW